MGPMRLREIDKKIVVLGDGKVGKTSMIMKYLDGSFSAGYIPSTGVNAHEKELQLIYPNSIINLRMTIWDTCGQNGYNRIRDLAFDGADGAVIVGDLSRPETISSIEESWIDEVKDAMGELPIAIIGNKSDLISKRNPSIEHIESVGAKIGAKVVVASAKTGEKIDTVFRMISELFAEEVVTEIRKNDIESPSTLQGVIDYIVEDFLAQHGSMEKGMLIVRNQFREAGLDLENPDEEAVLRSLERLQKVEEILLSEGIARANCEERKKILESLKRILTNPPR